MPIYDVECRDCGHAGEVISLSGGTPLTCPQCGGPNVHKRLTATSALTGKTPKAYPGPGDTACCGTSPDHAGCSGPGSCCGKSLES
jgi:putative FmdB family regulatory protein